MDKAGFDQGSLKERKKKKGKNCRLLSLIWLLYVLVGGGGILEFLFPLPQIQIAVIDTSSHKYSEIPNGWMFALGPGGLRSSPV